MFEYPVQKELNPESVACLPLMISPGLFYSITNVAALGLGHQVDEAAAAPQLQRTAYEPLPYLMPPPPQQEQPLPIAADDDGNDVCDDDTAMAAASAPEVHDHTTVGAKRQHGNVSAMSDYIDTNIASVSGEVGWVAPVGSYNSRQLSLFNGQETVTISIDGCRFLPHVCCCVQAYVFVVGPGASVLCSFVASSRASSAALSPKFLAGIRSQMQWPRVLTLCIFLAAVDSHGTIRALASTAHPLLVDAGSRRQWTNALAAPPAGLAWLDGNVQVSPPRPCAAFLISLAASSYSLFFSYRCVWVCPKSCRD
jgi:hypothetical protein